MMRIEMMIVMMMEILLDFLYELFFFFFIFYFISTHECNPMISAPMNDDRSCFISFFYTSDNKGKAHHSTKVRIIIFFVILFSNSFIHVNEHY